MEVNILLFPELSLHQWEFMSHSIKLWIQEQRQFCQLQIKIIVTASNEARFYSFVLNKAFNSQLKEDVVGEIDNENRKITLRLPKGTNVTRLAPNIDYGSGTGTAVADEFTSGRSHDFTNPVQYVLTAPDGVTKITYTVYSRFYDETRRWFRGT